MILSYEQLNQNIINKISANTPDKVVFIFSENSFHHCGPHIEIPENANVVKINDGESGKNLNGAASLWEKFLNLGCTRKSIIIAVGGGTLLDLTGFCASTFMRGIDVIYVPTTLLSMVDSAEGGKTGINLGGKKNIVGTFQKASEIWIVPEFIKGLPQIEMLSGWAEIIKHGILAGGEMFETIQSNIPVKTSEEWQSIIQQNFEFKQSIVSQDFKESGIRKTLNLGHTIGHALEALNFGKPKINHGICVANGILIETQISHKMGLCSAAFLKQIEKIIFPLFPKVEFQRSEIDRICTLIDGDKKNENNQWLFSLPESIGKVNFNTVVQRELVIEVLQNWI